MALNKTFLFTGGAVLFISEGETGNFSEMVGVEKIMPNLLRTKLLKIFNFRQVKTKMFLYS